MMPNTGARQQGVALIVLVALIGIAATTLLITAIAGGPAADPDRQTERALSLAHRALIDYAVAVQPDTAAKRPGDLPCPDRDNDGDAETTCSAANERIGRLPVKTLEIPDLVDGYGERLWYALSGSFDRSTVNQCAQPGDAGCLNSDTRGTISVRGADGAVLHDGTNLPSGAIAVVLSAGPPITRYGASTPQDRGCTGDPNVAFCQLLRRCSNLSGTAAMCNPVNYLDAAPTPAEDNANFTDSSTTDGFIQGPILDASGNKVVNDRLLVVRYADLMPRLEQRVAREAIRCLQDYAALPGNGGRYPWAASVYADYRSSLADDGGREFGRLPNYMPASEYDGRSGTWPASCPVSRSTAQQQWWANWQNLVFYALANGYEPDAWPVGCGGGCLTVNSPSPADKKAVVVVAGRRLGGQSRGVGRPADDYLEDTNANGGSYYKQAPAGATFNDTLLFL
jgi:type II secretory pathway pseudopilin PulG